MTLTAQEELDRLRLIRSENVGPITFRQLMARFKSAGDALAALPGLAARGGRKGRIRIASRDDVIQELERLQSAGGQMLHLGHPPYPAPLAAIDDAPPVLSVLGHPHLLTRPVLGIVGSRNASTNGKRVAAQFAEALGKEGWIIASGLALGIDAAAHHAALGSGTVAVVAGGVDVIYPRENTGLYHDIAAQGAVIAELPMGTVGQARHFPRRNRIISGLSRAVLVIEATQRSGSLITARLAAEQGRDVFAIPGSPLDPRARGGNDLIRKGATLVETPSELVSLLAEMKAQQLESPAPSPFEAPPYDLPVNQPEIDDIRPRLLAALTTTPSQVDTVIADLGIPPALIAVAILELELAGLVERLPGNRVVLLASEAAISAQNPPRHRAQAELFGED